MNSVNASVNASGTSNIQHGDNSARAQPTTPVYEELRDELRTRAGKELFEFEAGSLQSWPVLRVICAHVEGCFQRLLVSRFDSIWKTMDCPKPKEPYEVWYWCLAVLPYLRSDKTLEDTWCKATKFDKNIDRSDPKGEMAGVMAMFAVLCWTFLVLKPVYLDDYYLAFEGNTDHARRLDLFLFMYKRIDKALADIRQSSSTAKNPHSIVHLEDQPPDLQRADRGETQADLLCGVGTIYESTLEFDPPSRIGRLQVEQVDSIVNHLVFDQANHIVRVFCFPTLSAATIEGRNSGHAYIERV